MVVGVISKKLKRCTETIHVVINLTSLKNGITFCKYTLTILSKNK